MTKQEAIKLFVDRELNAIPQEWVKIVMEHEGQYDALPMWGWMWMVDRDFIGERLMDRSRLMVSSMEEIDLNALDGTEKEMVEKAIAEDVFLEDYVDEEMAGAHCVLDKDGNTTALYVYDIGGYYLIGVNGAGWDFYDGVWNKLYDLLGLKWHDEQVENDHNDAQLPESISEDGSIAKQYETE